MNTVIETATFQKQSKKMWSEEERLDFISWIAINPLAGDVIPNAEGARKVRWAMGRHGKRSSARIIYFNQSKYGQIILLAIYKKSKQENISHRKIQEANNGY
ncbi:MAG: transcriptional regulator [Thiomargarita sp.]|nr:transcriptional regulator [Thiomargarita sp.]